MPARIAALTNSTSCFSFFSDLRFSLGEGAFSPSFVRPASVNLVWCGINLILALTPAPSWCARLLVNQDRSAAEWPEEYLCGCCDGPLEDHVVALWVFRGLAGVVASSICWRCNLLLDSMTPTSEMDAQIKLLLADTAIT